MAVNENIPGTVRTIAVPGVVDGHCVVIDKVVIYAGPIGGSPPHVDGHTVMLSVADFARLKEHSAKRKAGMN